MSYEISVSYRGNYLKSLTIKPKLKITKTLMVIFNRDQELYNSPQGMDSCRS